MRTVRRVIILVMGLVVGAVAYGGIWGGAPARVAPEALAQGETRPREATPVQAGEVLLVLNEQFFNSILDAMFTFSKEPAFPLTRAGASAPHRPSAGSACASEIVPVRETGGVRTAVRFTDGGRISAPVAFRGSYEASPLGCIRFQGWAETEMNLEFDRGRQVLSARIQVRDLQLIGIPALLNNVVAGLVRNAIDSHVRPVEVLRAEQLAMRLPLAEGSSLRLRAKEVRPEVTRSELRLRIFYEIVSGE